MSIDSVTWLSPLMAVDTPVLPGLGLMSIGLYLAWGTVLASVVALVGRAWSRPARVCAVVAVALWCWVPGPYAPTHWLGLAFQSPSISTVLLCGVFLRAQFFPAGSRRISVGAAASRGNFALAAGGVLAGWLLLLDTLALLPVELYAWGFSPAATGLALLLTLVPWMVGRDDVHRDATGWLGPLAVVLFVALRWPTGNVWDALLDPWLWVALHVYLAKSILKSTNRNPNP